MPLNNQHTIFAVIIGLNQKSMECVVVLPAPDLTDSKSSTRFNVRHFCSILLISGSDVLYGLLIFKCSKVAPHTEFGKQWRALIVI